MSQKLSGGANAVKNGRQVEQQVETMLYLAGLRRNEYARSINTIVDKNHGPALFSDDKIAGQYKDQITVSLLGGAHQGRNRNIKVDFGIADFHDNKALISIKSQLVSGTVQEKAWWEIFRIIETQYPAAILICGNGWGDDFLQELWDLTRWHGKNILLFRELDSLHRWLKAGFPIPGKIPYDHVFNKFCDINPLGKSN